MKFPHYYLLKHIYCDSPSVYFSIISAKNIIVSKTYSQINYHRDGRNSKHFIYLNICTNLLMIMFLYNVFFIDNK